MAVLLHEELRNKPLEKHAAQYRDGRSNQRAPTECNHRYDERRHEGYDYVEHVFSHRVATMDVGCGSNDKFHVCFVFMDLTIF